MKLINSLNKIKEKYISDSLIKNNMKRLWTLSAVYFMILFIMYPITFMINKDMGYIYSMGYYNQFQQMLHLGDAGIFTTIINIAFAFILGLILLSYMHKKDEMIFTNSLPMNKTKLYFSSFASMLILTMIPLTIITGIISIEKIALDFTAIRLLDVLRFYLTSIIVIFVTYAGTAFCSAVCGTTIFTTLLTAFLSIFPFIISSEINAGICEFFKGGYWNIKLENDFIKYSPLIRFLAVSENEFDTKDGIIYLLIGFVFLTLGLIIYKIKKNEMTSESISFKSCKYIIKYVVTILAVLPFALAFGMIYNYSITIAILGGLLGLFVTYFALEMIIEKSFFVWNSYKGFIVLSIIYFLTIILINFDTFGYSSYTPNLNDVESVYYGSNYNDSDGYYIFENNRVYKTYDSDAYADEFCNDKNAINSVIKLSKKLGEISYSDFERNTFEDRNYVNKEIAFKLKNGKVIVRDFTFELKDAKDEILELMNNKEFKKAQIIDLIECMDESYEIDELTLYSKMCGINFNVYDKNIINEFVNSLINDYVENDFTYEDLILAESNVTRNDILGHNKNIVERYEKEYPNVKSDISEICNLPKIRKSYVNTLNVLKKYGYYNYMYPSNDSVIKTFLYKVPSNENLDYIELSDESNDSIDTMRAKYLEENYKSISLTNDEALDYYIYSLDANNENNYEEYSYYLIVYTNEKMKKVSNGEFYDLYDNVFIYNVFSETVLSNDEIELDSLNEYGEMIEAK